MSKLNEPNIEDIQDLTYVQEEILYAFLSDARREHYSIEVAISFVDSIDENALLKSWKVVESRNDVLRSVFRWKSLKKPVQVVLKETQDVFEVTDDTGYREIKNTAIDIEVSPVKIYLLRKETGSDLILRYHHILFDGWSLGIVLKELLSEYHGCLSGVPVHSKRKPSFNVFKQYLLKSNKKRSAFFWNDYLKNLERAPIFNRVKTSTPVRTDYYNDFVDVAGHNDILTFCKKRKVTLASLIYLAWGILLQKLSNCTDAVFGTVTSTRPETVAGIDEMVGLLIATLPFRFSQTSGSGESNLAKVQETIRIRNDFEFFSHSDLLKAANLDSRHSLWDSIVAIENYPLDRQGISAATNLEVLRVTSREEAVVPLVLCVTTDDKLNLSFAFQETHFLKQEVSAICDYFKEILFQLVQNPERCISTISLVKGLLSGLSGKKSEVLLPAEEKSIVSYFEQHARRDPNAVALQLEKVVMTYGEVNAQATRLANLLVSRGVKANTIVPLFIANPVQQIIAILGVLKSGGAYLPIDISSPIGRVQLIIADIAAKLMLISSETAEMAEQCEIDKIHIDRFEEGVAAHVEHSLEDLAYCIYTSGSTGRPKGVLIDNHGLVNFIMAAQRKFNGSESPALPLLCPYHFDGSIAIIFSALANGKKLILFPSLERLDIFQVKRSIIEERVAWLIVVPVLFRELIHLVDVGELQYLKSVTVAGEKVLPADIAISKQKLPNTTLINEYGPTETSVVATLKYGLEEADCTNIGKPIDNVTVHVLDRNNIPLPPYLPGEIGISGRGLSRGYVNNPELTHSKFVDTGSGRTYLTGDIARLSAEKDICFVGRSDYQVKVRGMRIELGEIESQLREIPQVEQAVVVIRDEQLIGFVKGTIDETTLRNQLAAAVPKHMIPEQFIFLDSIPISSNGKVDRNQLPAINKTVARSMESSPSSTAKKVRQIWSLVLGKSVDDDEVNFFDAGGDSLKLLRLQSQVYKEFGRELPIATFFSYPTIADLATHLKSHESEGQKLSPALQDQKPNDHSYDVAVVGIACRFPGANNWREYWKMLTGGKEGLWRDERPLNSESSFIKVKGRLADADCFDSNFFGYTPREASLLDPQTRVFHETVWEALEDAGCAKETASLSIGLFAGASLSPNSASNATQSTEFAENWANLQYTEKDFLATRLAYNLNLKGPCITINTACSTSLVAVDLAVQSLCSGRCDVAVAGGVSITSHDEEGYKYEEGMIFSRDGYCRTFDKHASGTISGNGSGVVVLKKLQKALDDGDNIYAVIKGSSVNNDGKQKVGFTAPSIEGQAAVIRDALRRASLEPSAISYIEAHGTATQLGDVVEIDALTKIFGAGAGNSCAIGSVKSNFGHLDVAAGIAGLIKTILALKYRTLPPSLNFKEPNPNLHLTDTPFFVNDKLRSWMRNNGAPLRAGVSSFGIGGTNAHIIVEEFSPVGDDVGEDNTDLITISAKSAQALDRRVEDLKRYLEEESTLRLSDISYTLNTGRESFSHRSAFVCHNAADLKRQLDQFDIAKRNTVIGPRKKIVFLFPGQGSQYIKMAHDLYSEISLFRNYLDECFDILQEINNKDFRDILFTSVTSPLNDTCNAQPILFSISYVLAKCLRSFGIQPDAMIGHSIGEYVAACIADVFSLRDALRIVSIRGTLMQKCPRGLMLDVEGVESQVRLHCENKSLSIAAINSPERIVVSGDASAIDALRYEMNAKNVIVKDVQTSHAFHSVMMDPILSEFENELGKIQFNKPRIPYISNISGEWISADEICKPSYWSRQLREAVQFAKGVQTIAAQEECIFIEVGAGGVLGGYVSKIIKNAVVVPLMKRRNETGNDLQYFLSGLQGLWLNGVRIDFTQYYIGKKTKKLSLPTYSFEKTRFQFPAGTLGTGRHMKQENWFYAPSWRREASTQVGLNESSILLLMQGNSRTSSSFYRNLKARHANSHAIKLREDLSPQIDRIFDGIETESRPPIHVVYFIDTDCQSPEELTYSVLDLIKRCNFIRFQGQLSFSIIVPNLFSILGSEHLNLQAGPLASLPHVIRQELPGVSCNIVEFDSNEKKSDLFFQALLKGIADERHATISLRYGKIWIPSYQKLEVPPRGLKQRASLTEGGVYVIVGGLGSIGLALAKGISKKCNLSLALISRSPFPDENLWDRVSDASILKKISSLREIKQSGSLIGIYHADISEEEQLQQAFQDIRGKFGAISGIIVSVGETRQPGTMRPVLDMDRSDISKQFKAKVDGTTVLEKIIALYEPEWVVFNSSISSILGGLGMFAYSAANTYLDHYALVQNSSNALTRHLSINWDRWRDDSPSLMPGHRASAVRAIGESDGVEAFLSALEFQDHSQIIISATDLEPRLEQWTFTGAPDLDSYPVANQRVVTASISGAERPGLLTPFVAPSSVTEELLASAWIALFGYAKVGVLDNFYELGGDSLKAVKLKGNLEATLKRNISLEQIFKYTTIRELASAIDESAVVTKRSIGRGKTADWYPVSAAQRRMYLLHQMNPDSIAYNMPSTFLINGTLSLGDINTAIGIIIERHEALRTRFNTMSGEVVQFVSPNVSFALEEYSLSDGDVDEITTQFIRPFDLAVAPLIRVGVIETSSEQAILMVDMHHIVSDGISESILLQELGAILRGTSLEAVPYQYKDFVLWQQQPDQLERIKKQKHFWIREFSEEIPLLELPADYPRPTYKSFNGASIEHKLPVRIYRDLTTFTKEQGTSTFVVLLASYAVLLSKLSSQKNVVVGVPVSVRESVEFDNTIGLFINTLPFNCAIEHRQSFTELVHTLGKKSAEAFANRDIFYEELLESLNIERSSSRNPLFDVMFVYQNIERHSVISDRYTIRPRRLEAKRSKFDLNLLCIEMDGQMTVTFEYCTDLFTRETIERFAGFFLTLLERAISDPRVAIGNIELIGVQEREQVVEKWNATERAYSSDQTIHNLFEKRVLTSPDSTAIVTDTGNISYTELNARANQVASCLLESGVQIGDCVAVFMERSPDLIIALLATLKAGARYVPLTPNLPDSRVEKLFKMVGISFLITDHVQFARSLTLFAPTQAPKGVVCFDGSKAERIVAKEFQVHVYFNEEIAMRGKENPTDVVITSDDFAYVIFTSGSTGNPKGVLVRHKPVVNVIEWVNRTFNLNHTDRLLFVTSVSFDLSVYDIFGILASGGSIVVANEDDLKDPKLLIRKIIKHNVSFWDSAPAPLAQLVPFLPAFDSENNRVRLVFLSGDWIPVGLPDQIREHFKSAKVVSLGGATEAAIWSNFYPIGEVDRKWKSIPYGKPIQNAKYYVLDENLRPCPVGVPGDLFIGGECLADGYLNEIEKSADRFIANPFARGKMYMTGDRCRWMKDGNMEFLGRVDHQIKIKGYRIELGEIETTLRNHESVQNAIVVVKQGKGSDRYLCGYYVGDAQPNTIKNYLKNCLPAYMVPTFLMQIDVIPLNANGKLDRRSLPDPNYSDSSEAVSIPRSSEERVLKEVWEEILYKPKVNIERDNFFEIGGDSIKAIQIATKLSARGYKMDIRDIFLYSTIQDLAPRISKKQICLSPADKLNLSGEISFTPIQQWFYDTVTVDRDHFNQALYIELSHRIDPDYARQVFKTILQSHPVLRAKVTAHRMLQIDEEKPTDVLSVHEVGTEAGADEVIQKITNALQESFILESGPLFKAALIQRTNRTGIFLVAHHLVIDGMSWRILLNDLQSLMDRTQRSEPLVLDRFGNSFSDWSKAVNRYATRIPDSEVNFWRKQVRLGNKMPFSRDFPVETSLICDSTVANTVLSTEKTRMLRSLVYENLSIDLRTMVLTALVRSLAQQFKTNDVFLWLEGHGRETLGEDLELGNTIGWFTTLYPLAIEIDKNSSILQFAKATKQSLKSIPNGGVGFGALKYGRADALPKSDNTRFVFNFLGDYDVEMGGMGFKLNNRFSKNTNSVRQTRPFDVEVICYVLDKELKIEAMFSESQFKKTSIDSLLSQITIGLEQLCSLALNYSSPVVVPAEMTFSQIDQSTMDKLCGSFEVEDILPLSPTQTGMLLATMMDDRSSVYCQQTWYFLNMAVDKDHLQAAFQQLVNRHEMLRVRFIVDGMDEPLQLVSKKRDANISSFDASHLGAEQQSALIEKLKRDNRANQFDIEKDLLVRLAFIKLNSDRYFFLWTYHHIIIDGWAMRRVFTEFFAIYSALAKGKPTPPRPSGSYKQFLAWLSNQNVDSGKAYWKKYLTGFMQPSHIGTKRTEVNVGSGYSSSKMILNLDRETSRIIRSVARQLKATVNSMIQVAWSIVLSKFSKKDDVVFGIVVMQRPAEIRNVEAIVGLMINTIPLRVNIRNADSFAEVVTRVHAQYAESQSYNYVSLGDIQLQSAVGQKLFDHVMVFDGGEFGSIDSGDVPQSIPREYITDVGASGQTNYAFDMHITSSDDIVIYFRYNQVVYSDEFIYHLKTMFAETIDQVVQYPHRKLGELTIHRTVEVSKVVADFNKDLH